ncbi:hypothetical protein BAE44_0024299 [Dichanthelium oligosanthes]|uniref:Uncharacterized protein n=1 Tax=Dichanthelium oligosanthes TaxID=888268 RepID=A0A1E5UP86_9POAL|nr:hypothetical protein BAE44_0024299 [Dichanthelium oligosanthes]
MFTRLPHAVAILRLLFVGAVAISTTARAQVVVLPNCNFQEVDLVPCMAAGSTAAAGAGGSGNISDACCSSLNKALDAGHRCACSLLLSNGVFASLVTSLLTLPLVLPLPGCFLYAPSLAACQATLQQQTSAPSAAASTAASMGGGADAALPPPTQAAAAMPRVDKHAGREQADDGRTRGSIGNFSSEAPSPAESVSRSDACRRPSSDEGRACILTFVVAIVVFWFNRMTDS